MYGKEIRVCQIFLARMTIKKYGQKKLAVDIRKLSQFKITTISNFNILVI